jgi:hypothetical protein
LSIFQQLKCHWHWIVIEGAAGNTADTSWCQKQKPRLSEDGTHEYLRAIEDERVTHIYKKNWPNKTEMCNAALEKITEPCVLMQNDSDEIWQPSQLDQIVRLFEDRQELSSIQFACRYFVGERLITQGQNCFGDHPYEWLRAWRYTPGRRFSRHEPPILDGDDASKRMSKDESRKLGLVFDHFAYAVEEQVEYKQNFYAYPGLVNQWRALQRNQFWPATLSRFFAHVKGDLPQVVKI